MNNIFNMSRFGRLFIKHTVEHYKGYLMALMVLLGVMTLGGSCLVFLMESPLDPNLQFALFAMILLLAGTMFTSTAFIDFSDKKKAVVALMLPASHFEKYLVLWLYSYLLFIPVYTCSFYALIYLLIHLKHFPGHHIEVAGLFYRNIITQTLLFYAFLHSITFCGSIFFQKLHFIKTAFAFFIGLGILIVTNNVLQRILLNRDVAMNIPFGGVRFMENNKAQGINLTMVAQPWLFMLIALLSVMFWVAAYFRLKEKQV